MKNHGKNKKILKRGFTMLESIVAIFILSLGIAGAFSAVRQGLFQTSTSKDEVKAFFMAQEAVEAIRNKRDSNQILKVAGGSSISWLNGISELSTDPCYFGKVCKVDASSMAFTYCGNSWGTCQYMGQSGSTYLYGYGPAFSTTKFQREIMLERISDDSYGNPLEILVTVRIFWTEGFVNREFKAQTLLFNWM